MRERSSIPRLGGWGESKRDGLCFPRRQFAHPSRSSLAAVPLFVLLLAPLLVKTELFERNASCPAGHTYNTMDSDLALFNVTCQPCPQGTFKSGEGSGPCTSCPNAGAFSHSASTAPSDCIGGTPSVENRCAMRSHDRKEIKTTWCPFTADVLQFCDASLGPGKMNRYGHSMTAVQDFVVLFGGFAYQEGFEGWGSADNNFYVLDTASPRMQWLPVGKHAVKPAARFFHTAVVHDTQLIIYGGRGSAFEDMESIWVLDLRTLAWEPKTTSGSMPLDTAFPPMHTDAGLSKRYAHTSVMTSDSRMIVFGGTTMGVGSGCLADTWMLDVRTWTWTLLETAGTRLDLLARYAMSGMTDTVSCCQEDLRSCAGIAQLSLVRRWWSLAGTWTKGNPQLQSLYGSLIWGAWSGRWWRKPAESRSRML